MFTLDTCALIHILRGSQTGEHINQYLEPFGDEPDLFVSIVTHAELISFAIQHKWGTRKMDQLQGLMREVIIVPIQSLDILNIYADIDAYSQGKHPVIPAPNGFSSKNMGKNDLWIGATAKITHSKLLTSDGDFDHLNGNFLDVEKIL